MPPEIRDQAEHAGIGMDQMLVGKMMTFIAHLIEPTCDNILSNPIDSLQEIMAQRGLRNRDLKIYISSPGNVWPRTQTTKTVISADDVIFINILTFLLKFLFIPMAVVDLQHPATYSSICFCVRGSIF